MELKTPTFRGALALGHSKEPHRAALDQMAARGCLGMDVLVGSRLAPRFRVARDIPQINI